MTTREEQELIRLEGNVRRLIAEMRRQAEELTRLRRLSQEQEARVQELETALEEARAQAQIAQVVSALDGEALHTGQAYAYLGSIISEIERSIRQLEQD